MTAEQIELEVRDALVHLYDPDFEPSVALCELTGCLPDSGAIAVQAAIIETIESMEPAPDTPAPCRVRKVYDLLWNRFILKLTLEETAERMDMSFSSTWRAQRVAVHSLTQTLWGLRAKRQQEPQRTSGDTPAASQASTADPQGADWRSQMQRELDSLRACSPDQVADVGDVVAGVAGLAAALSAGERLDITVQHVQPGLVAAVHPAVLRQAIIAAVRRLANAGAASISIYAGLEDGNVRTTLSGGIDEAERALEEDLAQGMVLPDSMSVGASVERAQAFFWVEAPSVGKTTVLVVDDNPDMVRFYRRATDGTSYRVTHIARGQQLDEAIRRCAPDVIVLDVMLPEIDGWQLLMRLHEDPETRSTPVIVCTVVREEQLAMSLGASAFLSKPVKAQEFVQALDQALNPTQAAGPKSAASTGAASSG
jgi:CheY-like chemotaxis protein